MKTNNITIKFREYNSPEELVPGDAELVISAREAAKNAYAPYSLFKVGAAVRLGSGKIITGVNIENAAFPSGICAERSALSHASSVYPEDKPVTMAIAAYDGDVLTDEPVPPCGNCRQVIAEEEFRHNSSIRLILSGKTKVFIIENGRDLLPLQFNRESLQTKLH